MPIMMQNRKIKLMCGGSKITKMYCQGDVIYSSGNIVMYYVDEYTVFQEEVEQGESCLEPKSFTPYREGYTFAGWSLEPSGAVVDSMIMKDEPIMLYAVWIMPQTLIVDNVWCINGVSGSKWTIVNGLNITDWAYGSWGIYRELKVNKQYLDQTGSFVANSPIINVNGCSKINFGAIYYNQSGNVTVKNATTGDTIGSAGGGNISLNIAGISHIQLVASALSHVHSGHPSVNFSGNVTLS